MRGLALSLPFIAPFTAALLHGELHGAAAAAAGVAAKRVAIIGTWYTSTSLDRASLAPRLLGGFVLHPQLGLTPPTGAGAAGSSTAYHLSRTASNLYTPVNISVFERNSYIGGRTTTVNAWSSPHHPIELGGSIFVSVNHILVSATEEFNLSTTFFEERYTEDDSIPEIGIWDGTQFAVVVKKEDGWWDKARLLWRYGLAPIKTNRLMKSTVAKFLKMYDEPVFPWRSLSEVAEKVGLVETTGVTGRQFLRDNGVGELFAREIIQAR